jgi:hypothetical protein
MILFKYSSNILLSRSGVPNRVSPSLPKSRIREHVKSLVSEYIRKKIAFIDAKAG